MVVGEVIEEGPALLGEIDRRGSSLTLLSGGRVGDSSGNAGFVVSVGLSSSSFET